MNNLKEGGFLVVQYSCDQLYSYRYREKDKGIIFVLIYLPVEKLKIDLGISDLTITVLTGEITINERLLKVGESIEVTKEENKFFTTKETSSFLCKEK